MNPLAVLICLFLYLYFIMNEGTNENWLILCECDEYMALLTGVG